MLKRRLWLNRVIHIHWPIFRLIDASSIRSLSYDVKWINTENLHMLDFFLFILVSMKLWTNSLLNFETIWSLAIYLFERLIDWCDSELNALCVIYLDSSAYSCNTIRSHVHDVLILCDRKWKIFARDDSNVIITFPRINMVSLSHLQISPNVAHSSIVLVPHYDPTHMF